MDPGSKVFHGPEGEIFVIQVCVLLIEQNVKDR